MADVRSMLRAERESRRLTHPHATYTNSGNLICNVCEVPIKSEKAWGAHLHSTQHNAKLGKQRDEAQAKLDTDSRASRKRKAEESDEDEFDVKRIKQAPNDTIDTSDAEAEVTVLITETEEEEDVEAAEFAALQQRLALLEEETTQEQIGPRTALTAPATISAPAISAEEVAAQAREDHSRQRSRRDEEIEAEKDDAARVLEDEFEEMDSLQERVRRLKEKREALRAVVKVADSDRSPGTTLTNATIDRGIPDRTLSNGAGDDVESSDDEEYDDNWTFSAQ